MAGCAIGRSIVIAVTIDTVAHLEIAHLLYNFHAGHVAVACRTGNAILDVRSVHELNVVREPVDPNPID